MIGPEGVKRDVVDHLRLALPARCELVAARLTDELGEDVTIAPPALYDVTERPVLGATEFPALTAEATAAPSIRLIQMDSLGNPVFLSESIVRIHLRCRSRKVGDRAAADREAELHRDRLLLCVLEELLDHPDVGTTRTVFDRTRFSWVGLDLYEDTPGRRVSPGFVQCSRVHAAEGLTREVLAEAPIDFEVTTHALEG